MAYKNHDKTDQDLLLAFCKEGDTDCLGTLLERYTGMLLGVCMKYLKNEDDAKDSVQQIFVKVINELQKYKVDYFKSWIYMVAKNYCLMRLRDKKNIHEELKDKIICLPDEKIEKGINQQKEFELTNLEAALKLLNEEQRVCVTLFYLYKKTYQEIIQLTKYDGLQVKSNIQNGKRNLKILMLRMPQHEQ